MQKIQRATHFRIFRILAIHRLAAAEPLTSRCGFADRFRRDVVFRRADFEALFRLRELEARFLEPLVRLLELKTLASVCRMAGVICPHPCCAICCAIHWLLLVGWSGRFHNAHAQGASQRLLVTLGDVFDVELLALRLHSAPLGVPGPPAQATSHPRQAL